MSEWQSANNVMLIIHMCISRFLCGIAALVRGYEQDENYSAFVTLLSIPSHSRFPVYSLFRSIQP